MPYIGNTTSDFSIDTGNITNKAVTATKLSPSSVGSNGQVLSVDGSGNLQWSADASGTALTGSTNNTITTVTGANAIQGEANLTFNNSALSIINTSNLGDSFLYIKAGEAGASVIELQADEADDNNDLWRIQNAGDSTLGFRSKTSGSWVEKLGITADGHVGIGVTPSAWPTNADSIALQIGTGFAAYGRGSGDEDRGAIAVNYYNDGSSEKYIANGHSNRIYMADGNIDFQYAASNASGAGAALTFTSGIRMKADGKVGIGTTSPAGKLEINAGSSGTDVIVLRFDSDSGGAFNIQCSDASSATPLWKFDLGISEALQIDSAATTRFLSGSGDSSIAIGKTGAANDAVVLKYDESGDKLHFYGWGGSEGDILTLDNGNSRVGIGTSSPDYLCEIEGSGGGESVSLGITNNTGSNPAGINLNSGHGNWSIYNSKTVGDALEFTDESASAVRMMIKSNGHISITSGNLEFANSAGVDFSNVSDGSRAVTSNLLDDYEEGTFTTTLNASDLTLTSNTYTCVYTKVGRLVHVSAYAQGTTPANISAYVPNTTHNMTISGLPFTNYNSVGARGAASIGVHSGFTISDDHHLSNHGNANSTSISVWQEPDTNGTRIGPVLIANTAMTMHFCFTYNAA